MEESRFTEEKTVRILREADRGSVAEPAKQTDMASVLGALGQLQHWPSADVGGHVRDNLRALVEME